MHEKKLPDEIELVFSFYNTELSNTVSVAHLLRHYHTELQIMPGCSGQVKFRVKFVKMFRANFGSAYKISSQRWTLWSPVTIEAIELSLVKMIHYEFSNTYFATPPIPGSCVCAYLDSLGKFGFRT